MNTVLIGVMGAGKSSVGGILADLLGRPFVDTDDLIETRCGRSIPDLWGERGEAGFREIEAAVVKEVAGTDDQVIAVGGGAILRADNVTALRRRSRLVWLRATSETLRSRVGADPRRPLATRLEQIAAEREPVYRAVADTTVDTDGRSPDEIATALARRVTVPIPGAAYDVVVAGGALGDLPRVDRAAMLGSASLLGLHGPAVEAALGGEVTRVEIPDGESAKTPAVMARIWDRMAGARVGREATVVGLGGGSTTDVAGFAAATYLRGIAWIAVPTTVLGMVDAAIGGKTGIDLQAGKNLVGSVWQPSMVVCDPTLLITLPERELRSGWAEIAKYGFIADPAILGECSMGVRLPDARLLYRCAEIKAAVVAGDEREHGARAHLNYGHTIGHAIEQGSGMSLTHGEAIAVGMVAAAELGHRTGLADVRAETLEVLAGLGLPSQARGVPRHAVEAALRQDKKRDERGLRFILLESLGRPTIVAERDLPTGALDDVLESVL